MKLVLDYLERALQLEDLASAEANPQLKSQLLDQASAYRRLAAEHAEKSGLPPPSPRDLSR
jgi:hypothetical protein